MTWIASLWPRTLLFPIFLELLISGLVRYDLTLFLVLSSMTWLSYFWSWKLRLVCLILVLSSMTWLSYSGLVSYDLILLFLVLSSLTWFFISSIFIVDLILLFLFLSSLTWFFFSVLVIFDLILFFFFFSLVLSAMIYPCHIRYFNFPSYNWSFTTWFSHLCFVTTTWT